MIDQSKLQQAAKLGLLQPEQVDPLFRFLQSGETDHIENAETCDFEPSDSTEEPLRFIRSFGDVFITIGIILLSLGLGMMKFQGVASLLPAAGFALLAEWLVRVRRLALPGIALLLAMLAFIADSFDAFGLSNVEQAALIALASGLFYLRHRMPFSLLPLVASLLACAFLLAEIPLEQLPRWFGLAGLLVFALALFFDTRDPQRSSYFSDNAFWLHLLAAPLMVHGAMITLLLNDDAGWIQAVGRENLMLLFFALFFLIAILLDRRALLISTQLYVIYAATQLIEGRWNNTENIVMYLVFALGLFVIFFGAYWYRVRRLVWGWVANYPIARWLPPFELHDSRFPPSLSSSDS